MSTEKFEALLILIVPQVVALIVQNTDLNELAASQAFYESEVYALLEQEDTKLWQLSPQTLFHMYEEETATGKITFPEGVGMSRQGDFLIYCTEQYKSAKRLNGRQVSELFTRYCVWEYVYCCYEALHTTGANYIVNDIDQYIEARKQSA